MAPTRVGIIGATGETGSSITRALLDDGSFVCTHISPLFKRIHPNIAQEVIALTRPASLEKADNKAYKARGVILRPFELDGTHEELVSGLSDIEVLIAAFKPTGDAQIQQIPLAKAAKAAGIKRFIPCAWRTVLPPTGLHMLREVDEQIMNEVKLIKLPCKHELSYRAMKQADHVL